MFRKTICLLQIDRFRFQFFGNIIGFWIRKKFEIRKRQAETELYSQVK